jgi:cytochrome c-type biogenesis protein CcmF
MASLGFYLLLAAFVVAAYAAGMAVAGARRRSTALVESGVGAFYLVAAIMAAASSVIVHAFVVGDYSIKYVARTSDSAQPLFYKLTSYWGGLDGSIMFWVSLLSVFGTVAVYINRERHRELIPYVVAIISAVEMFFLYLMIVHNNPFGTFLTENPADGEGLSPLLQNFLMVIHPPTMYLGFVGLTIPYAFGMAALITGYLDDSWLRAVRRWTMISWLFLSFGLGLGMVWAYEELGWGGYWMWDPVENAGALPWFTATAFLHSVMVQERRGMLRVWNVTLVITTFFLTIFGTFMTRSGVVQSVHAFGEDPELARLFTMFMVTIVVASFGLVIYRLPLLKARNELDSWVSREAAFMANNWILLFSAFFVLFATMFPTLSEAVTGQRITVGPPFFNAWMAPIGLILLLLTGIGPLLAWRKSTLGNLKDQFLFPILSGLVVGIAVTTLGVKFWSAGLCFALCGFVLGTVSQEFWHGARVRQKATGTDVFTALVGLVGRNKRRYGGYVVHVGIVLMCLGFAGEAFKQSDQLLLKPGQTVEAGDVTARLDALRVTDDGQKQMVTAHLTVTKDGQEVGKMYPARWYFRKHEDMPTTEVAIRRGFAEDIYLVLAAFEPGAQSATIELVVNPLVNWLWVGFGVVGLGTLIALLPESTFAFATATAPGVAGQATTVGLILLMLLGLPGRALAQVTMFTALEKAVRADVKCTCGCRRSLGLCGMPNCHGEAEQMALMRTFIEQGQNHQQVLASFVAAQGPQALMVPPNEGFNRTARIFPVVAGIAGLVLVGVTAVRWSRRKGADASTEQAPIDPTLDARLDDELRDLD